MIRELINNAAEHPWATGALVVSQAGLILTWIVGYLNQFKVDVETEPKSLPINRAELDKVLWCMSDCYPGPDESDYEWERMVRERVGNRDVKVLETFCSSGVEAIFCRYGTVLIVAIRGTSGLWDTIRDLWSWKVNAPMSGKAHYHFMTDARLLYFGLGLSRALARHRQLTDRLVISGHSMGGATAIQLASLMCERSDIENEDCVVALCAPRSADKTNAETTYRRMGGRVYRFTNSRDLVPLLPPMWFGYWHVGPTLYFDSSGEFHPALTLGFRVYDLIVTSLKDVAQLRCFRGLFGYHNCITVADLVRLAAHNNRLKLRD